MPHTRIIHKQYTLTFLATFLARNRGTPHLICLVSTSTLHCCPCWSSVLSIMQKWETAKKYPVKWMVKWKWEIIGILWNGEMKLVVTNAPRLMAMAVAMDSRCRLLNRSLKWHHKHCRRWSTNHNGPLKLCKYHVVLRKLRLRDCDWSSKVDGVFRISLKRYVADIKKTSPAMTRKP